jgi:hypothetical protein
VLLRDAGVFILVVFATVYCTWVVPNVIMKLLFVYNLIALESCSETLVPHWDGLDTMPASVAKRTTPMLLVGKSVRTPRLQSFRALVLVPLGEILGFSTEPLI